MRNLHLIAAITLQAAALSAQTTPRLAPSTVPVEKYLKLPLAFERQGPAAEEKFVARGQGYAIGLWRGKATIGLVSDPYQAGRAVSMEFAGARATAAIPGPELPGKVNYIQGNEPRKWQTGLSTWERVRYPNIYPGIDVIYYGNQQQLEFDLVVRPGANPESIRMKIAGSSKLSLDRSGALDINPGGSQHLRIELPKIYQEVQGSRRSVSGHYSIEARDEVAFHVDPYDHTRSLVIDPTILYSTLLGGGLSSSTGQAIAVDSAGNILVAGNTYAADFPTVNAFQSGLRGSSGNGFVAKINAAGTALIYSTYIGGSNYNSFSSIAVDSAGSAWVTGYTFSTDFPVLNPVQSANAGSYDAVVVKLSANGALQFSTYLGGSSYDEAYGIAVDTSGNAYVTGYTQGPFPTTFGTILTPSQSYKAFVAKFGSSGGILYSTLLGGSSSDFGYSIAVDAGGNAYVTGYSYSSSFAGAPSGGAQPGNNGGGDAFVAKVNPTGSGLLYFTFLGGSSFDEGRAIAVDTGGNAYIGGQTSSTGLATPGAAQTSLAGATDGFIAKLNPAGSSFLYVTYLGGSRQDYLDGLALDGSGNVYVAGYTDSRDFPITSALQSALPGNGVSLFQSTNSGSAWSAFDANISGAVFDVSVDPSNSATMVVATESGIYRTVNSGASWSLQSSLSSSSNTTVFTRSPGTPGTLYVTTCCTSIYKSTDDGVTWNYSGSAPSQAEGMIADPLAANTVYLFGYTPPYVYVSTNGGSTWNPAAAGLPGTQIYTMTATSDGVLYAGTLGSGIYKSTNQGASWSAVNTGLPQNSYAYQHSLSASGTTAYFAAGTIYSTTNGGASWAALPASIGAGSVAADPQNSSVLYAITYAGTVQVSTNAGSSWSAVATGLPSGLSYSSEIVVDPTNSMRAFLVAQVYSAAFVSKLNSTGSALIWSTYLGGSSYTYAYGIAANGPTVFVTGYTSGNFPVTASPLPSGTYGALVTEISDATATCAVTASPKNPVLSQYGQTLTFSVVTPSGCAWTAGSNQSWAAIASGGSGTGVGSFTVQAVYNSTGTERTAILTVGGQSITLTQASSSCVFSLDQSTYSVGTAGGTLTAFLTAGAGCPWSVTNSYPGAVTVTSGATGAGNGAIGFSVTPNLTANTRNFYLSVGTTQIHISQSGALQLVTLPPCRVMDTRNPAGPLGGPFIAAATTRTIPVPFSACGVPASAVAYSLNITVVPRTGTLGYLSVWPTGQSQPLVSTLNSIDGSVLANAAIVPAGAGGSIDAYATNDTELIIDINGYFVPPTTGSLQFYPLTPCRILDTRNPTGTFGGPSLAGGTSRSFPVPSSSCGVPAGAAAYSLNMTVVPQGLLGYLTTWPTGQTQPVVSTLNSLDGTVLANAAIVPAGTNGAVSFFAANTTDLIVDINGYFAPPATGGLNFYTATPCRIVDTRNPAGTFGGPILNGGTERTFPLSQGSCGLPATAAAYSLNMTVVPSGLLGYLTTWPTGVNQPVVSTLNAFKGQVVANAAMVPAGAGGAINVYVTNTTHIIIDTNGFFGQ